MSFATQSRFAGALHEADGVPEGITSWNGPRPERRFEVYRNNVAYGLGRALAARFPVAEKLVGEEFFAGMARAFIAAHPPRTPLLLFYGDEFADFVAGFAPAAELPYLPDVIRLEAARGHAYHAADVAPLAPSALAGVSQERLFDLVFEPHPSLSVLRSVHPVVTIWAMNAGEMPLAPLDAWTGEDALIIRPALHVLVRRLPPGGAAFLRALAGGAALGAAAEVAFADDPQFDLTANLTGAFEAGVFAAFR
ncbi:DUF2063 domain-containing protein [Starkeya sp. ORNL1]|uniref:HvfC/BufC N-terminal domain-containing protein n=1 Tax=Starkeya sp. ORNL1 TaxID=2709380 RepID=UPI001463A79B|nr:DNA-binding domain-containing protein [Starkeya sp. ORNL1]QJP15898.1 DUF2063 domain-containing protein [Starkeya sp. ORNL1]